MNRKVVLARYPDGTPRPEDFAFNESPAESCGDGEVLVEVSHLSMDPFPRLRMRAEGAVGPPMMIGETVEGRGVGRVAVSRHPDWQAGDWLHGELGWQSLARLRPSGFERIDPGLAAPQHHLSALGPSGLTAYMTVLSVADVQPGQLFAFAPAAGSVGSIAGQIARMHGARTVGLANVSQLDALADFGYEQAVDIARPEAAPDAIDVFIDGVGGTFHDAMLAKLAPRARVVLLGFISAYNDASPPRYGAAMPVLMKRLRVEGFLLADWAHRFADARADLARWLASAEIKPVETIWQGLDSAPAAFVSLFGDATPGKQIVAVEG